MIKSIVLYNQSASTLQSSVTDASISETSHLNGRPKKFHSDFPPLVKDSISTTTQFLYRNRMLLFYLDSLLAEGFRLCPLPK